LRDCEADGGVAIVPFLARGAEEIPIVLAIRLWWWRCRDSTAAQRAGPAQLLVHVAGIQKIEDV